MLVVLLLCLAVAAQEQQCSAAVLHSECTEKSIAEDALSGGVPLYAINLKRATARRTALEAAARQWRVKGVERFVNAVDGRSWHRVSSNATVEQWCRGGSAVCTLVATMRNSRYGWWVPQPRLLSAEVATTMSHLNAVREAYRDGVEMALVVEDDVSFEMVPDWGLYGLDRAISELQSTEWGVCQLAVTFGLVEGGALLERQVDSFARAHLVRERDPWADLDLWNAAAYLIHRRGMERLLAAHWPGGIAGAAAGPDFDALPIGTTIDLRSVTGSVSDALMYSQPGTFVVTRPLFTTVGSTSSVPSLIGRVGILDFFDPARASVFAVRERFYGAAGATVTEWPYSGYPCRILGTFMSRLCRWIPVAPLLPYLHYGTMSGASGAPSTGSAS